MAFGAAMSDSTNPPFVFEGAELLASALHAQLLARRQATFEHDLKNVVHGLLSGTELLRKAFATNSARISPAECLTLLQQQLARAESTLHHMLAEVVPAAAPTSDIDLTELIEECTHDLRHQLQRFKVDTSLEPHLKVRAQRPRLKNALLGVLLETTDHAPLSSTLILNARRDDADRVVVEIRHAFVDSMPSGLLAAINEMLQLEDVRVDVATSPGERCLSMRLPMAAQPATSPDANRLIIVDANRDAADSLAMLVQLEGFETQVAYDIESGLQYARARAPSALIIDVDGSVDSTTLIARLREEMRSTIRIIGMSYSPEPSLADVDAQLRKPLDPGALRSVLERG